MGEIVVIAVLSAILVAFEFAMRWFKRRRSPKGEEDHADSATTIRYPLAEKDIFIQGLTRLVATFCLVVSCVFLSIFLLMGLPLNVALPGALLGALLSLGHGIWMMRRSSEGEAALTETGVVIRKSAAEDSFAWEDIESVRLVKLSQTSGFYGLLARLTWLDDNARLVELRLHRLLRTDVGGISGLMGKTVYFQLADPDGFVDRAQRLLSASVPF